MLTRLQKKKLQNQHENKFKTFDNNRMPLLPGNVLHLLCQRDNNNRKAFPNKIENHWIIDECNRNRANSYCIVFNVLRRYGIL